MNLPPDLPPEAVAMLEEMHYLESDRLKVGDLVPCLTLTNLQTGETVDIGTSNAALPTVLIFGSYT